MMDLAIDPQATPEVRALADDALHEIRGSLEQRPYFLHLADAIKRFQNRALTAERVAPVASDMPPGQPIGGATQVTGWSSCSW